MNNRHTPPGPGGRWGINTLLAFQRDPLTFFSGVRRSYGDIANVRMLGREITLFASPEYAYYFLVENAQNFSSGASRGILRRFLGEALLTTDGDIHRRQRRLVQPAFHRKRVESYAATMTAQTQQMLAQWKVGDEVDMSQALQELTLRIIVQALFDVDLETQGTTLSHLFTTVIESQRPGPIGETLAAMNIGPVRQARVARDKLDAFVYQLIAQRRAEGRDHGDVLSMLLAARDEDGAPMSDLQIRDQAMTLMAAGHETTSISLAWTFYLLSRNPDKYDRLRAEVADVLGGRTATAADLPRLPYLDAVITEALRIYPPAWTVNREALEPFNLGGYHFPAGTRAIISQWVIHHLPEVWGDPEVFSPERWTPEFRQSLPRGAYFPFGAGPRICIGMPLAEMEARLLLATILQRFTPRVVPGWPVEPRPRVTIRMKHGIRMRLDAPATPATPTVAGTLSATSPATSAWPTP
ncbi:MAG TPA: cytochrome P450 [Ktedonobacterales bacterium]|nr:cytochrome P450 [Ktedonobacterales bacterium]